MSNDLLTKLGEKIQNAVETIELLRLEIGELKAENAALLEEKEEWDSKLSSLIDQFESLGYEDSEIVDEGEVETEDGVEEEFTDDDDEEEIVVEYEEDEEESGRFGRESRSA